MEVKIAAEPLPAVSIKNKDKVQCNNFEEWTTSITNRHASLSAKKVKAMTASRCKTLQNQCLQLPTWTKRREKEEREKL